MLSAEKNARYIAILQEELLPATGCTEPIAIAYCAARLKEILGAQPEHIDAEVSGNIIKNVKSVVVPNTGRLKGINAAIATGVVAGDAKKLLQVISFVPAEERGKIKEYMENTPINVIPMDTTRMLEIRLTGYFKENKAVVHIANNHTNIIYEEKNGEVIKSIDASDSAEDNLQDKSVLNIKDIIEFADSIELSAVAPLLEKQIKYNYAIAEEGVKNDWGANIGSVLLDGNKDDINTRAIAYAAAASDARMSGCELPVVIVTGSGNQGITASVPVICYADYIGADKWMLYRALLVSNLVTIHQKTGIGRLSAYCGAVSAGCGAGAGIAYLLGGRAEAISNTVSNTLAMLSGTICDGAKPSCASKIAMSVEAGLLGYHMYLKGQSFHGGDGIVGDGVEATITNIGRLASEGMCQTDKTILQIMTGK